MFGKDKPPDIAKLIALVYFLVSYIPTKSIAHIRTNMPNFTGHNKRNMSREHTIHIITICYHDYRKTERPRQTSSLVATTKYGKSHHYIQLIASCSINISRVLLEVPPLSHNAKSFSKIFILSREREALA